MKQGVLTPGRVRLLLRRGWPKFLFSVLTIFTKSLKASWFIIVIKRILLGHMLDCLREQ